MRKIAAFMFFLNPILWASYFAVTKEALERFDPAIFATLDMLIALPFGLVILAIMRRHVNNKAILAGTVLGSFHAVETLIEMYALDYTTATNTGMLSNLQGVVAIFIAFVFLGRRIGPATWVSGALSLAGVALLLMESAKAGGNWIGDALAILAMVIFVVHVFAIDKFTANPAMSAMACLGVEQIVAALVTVVGSLFLAEWQSFTTPLAGDILVLIYISVCTGIIPSAIALTFQPYVSPVYVVFIYLVEPLWVALIALFYLGETLTPVGYFGGSLIVFGALLNTLFDKTEVSQEAEPAKASR